MAVAEAPEYPDKIDTAVLKVAGVVVLGAIMSILDITVVNVALPTFQTQFGTVDNPIPYSHVAWTVTAYTLALATVIPMTGWAADRFGTKRLYLTALGLFTSGSALCAAATSINMLIVFRIAQGMGGGMLMPLGMTIMTRAAGPKRMGRLMALLGVPMLLGPILGPILGGWLIDNASWHWIFLINVPIGIVAVVYAFVILPSDRPEPSESFDFIGVLLLSPGLALFLFGVSSLPAENGDFSAPRVWGSMLVGLVLMLGFVWHAFRPEHPLLDLRLYRNRNLAVSSSRCSCSRWRSSAVCCSCPRTSRRCGVCRRCMPVSSSLPRASARCSRCRWPAFWWTASRSGASCRSGWCSSRSRCWV